ncbi:hypothetical protein PL321_06855 [Caloramator sp. mosi_1]|uniref:hypothetical protein n=1 Tax=Caloramator sp. mosi_1 TaxID=3023090 RepID=UPI00235F9A08|nr:hypothetical protein [Caloramator sp. mosi_1]WDC85183.1 hypothetical protein PL321_06855 [Caloramator sp. mosi_1]
MLDGLSIGFSTDKSKNNIVYGLNLKELEDRLWVNVKDGGYKTKEGITAKDEDSVVQLIEANEDTFVLALNSINKSGLKSISTYLSDFSFVEGLKGNVCVINSMGTVKTYYVESYKYTNKYKAIAYICLGASVFILFAIFIIDRREII